MSRQTGQIGLPSTRPCLPNVDAPGATTRCLAFPSARATTAPIWPIRSAELRTAMRISFSVTPTHSFFGSAHPTFVIAQAIASTYYDLARLHWTEAGRSIIALRGYAAEAFGAEQFSLPPDQRLYAGGSATVRGYAYQTVGPQFPNGNPIGGTSLGCRYPGVASTTGRQLRAGGVRGRRTRHIGH